MLRVFEAVPHSQSASHIALTLEYTMLSRNVLGTDLLPCSYDPLTGYYRDGCCQTDEHDHGTHVVCARMTQAFLDFSLKQGNDLITARPEYRFAGL